MRTFRRLAVYCASSNNISQRYFDAARRVGDSLARRGIGIVYGGGRVGLMGAVADGALEAGGEVIGVITKKLMALEVGHQGLTERYEVNSMHSRKTMMAQLADGFMALPGGWGTLEEVFEAATWTQLNYHMKPVGLLNIGGYYDKLIGFLGEAAQQGFIRPTHRDLIQVADDLDDLLYMLANVEIPKLGEWKP